jgi:hypothetical protein
MLNTIAPEKIKERLEANASQSTLVQNTNIALSFDKLTMAIIKHLKSDNRENIVKEMANAYITLAQLETMLNCSDEVNDLIAKTLSETNE